MLCLWKGELLIPLTPIVQWGEGHIVNGLPRRAMQHVARQVHSQSIVTDHTTVKFSSWWWHCSELHYKDSMHSLMHKHQHQVPTMTLDQHQASCSSAKWGFQFTGAREHFKCCLLIDDQSPIHIFCNKNLVAYACESDEVMDLCTNAGHIIVKQKGNGTRHWWVMVRWKGHSKHH